jgi:hypothetical protein
VASGIQFSEEEYAIIWQFNSLRGYSVQSLYAMVNNRGVRQIFTPVVWKIKVPSRIHIFLCLLAKNKNLTRDNLAKRRHVEDKACLFCNELETTTHLFFECCVAVKFWAIVSEVNVCTSGVLWALWKTHSDMCFQGLHWTGIPKLLGRCASMLKN